MTSEKVDDAIRAVELANLNYGHKEMLDRGTSQKDVDSCETARARLLALIAPERRAMESAVIDAARDVLRTTISINHPMAEGPVWMISRNLMEDIRSTIAALDAAEPAGTKTIHLNAEQSAEFLATADSPPPKWLNDAMNARSALDAAEPSRPVEEEG